MKPAFFRNGPIKLSVTKLLFLITLEGVVAALATFWVGPGTQNAVFLGRSHSRWALIFGLLAASALIACLAFYLSRHDTVRIRFDQIIASRACGAILSGLVGLCFGVIFISHGTNAFVLRLMPALAWGWLAGFELVLLGMQNKSGVSKPPVVQKRAWLAVVTVLCIYLAASLPAPLQAEANGLPWYSLHEFLCLTFLLPATLFIDWRTLARTSLLVGTAFFLMVRVILVIFVPPQGIEVHAYDSSQAIQSGAYIHSYETIFHPSLTTVMTRPYTTERQLPLEWTNTNGFEMNTLWLGLNLSGYLSIKDAERVVFLVEGAEEEAVTLTDLDSDQTTTGTGVHSIEYLTPELFQSIPKINHAQLDANLVFAGEQKVQVIPLLLYADGSYVSLMDEGRAWRSEAGLRLSSSQIDLASWLSRLMDAYFLLLCLAGLVTALISRYRQQDLDPIDLYLAAGSLLAFWAAQAFPGGQILEMIRPLLIGLLVIRILGAYFHPEAGMARRLFVSVGLPVLVMILGYYQAFMNEIEVFPQGQDNLSYQMIARSIYVSGDFFQLRQPPLVYKFLYPYLVGFLHLLFGQAPSAQHFLNAGCAFLTCACIVSILHKRGAHKVVCMVAAGLWLVIVSGPSFSTFYFRFGLIEPLAVVLLVVMMVCGQNRQYAALVITGIALTLLRLDYAILAFTTVWLLQDRVKGGLKQAWGQILIWTCRHWKRLALFGASLGALPTILISYYWLKNQTYLLRAGDTQHTSLASILEGWFRVLSGGSLQEIQARFSQNPIDMGLIILVLYGGVLAALLPLLFRWGVLRRTDPYWGLLVLALFFTFMLVKPTGYSPRFSTPLVPLALLAIFDRHVTEE